MDGDALTYEQFDDELYIIVNDNLIGRIINMERDNYYIIFEDDGIRIPEHGLDNAKRYVNKHYKEHEIQAIT